MFQTAKYIQARTKKGQPNRFQYIQSLVTEYQTLDTKLETASTGHQVNLTRKRRILARLANFAYDPINYDILWQLNVLDIFLDAISTEEDVKLIEYGMSGICNYCIDPQVCRYLIKEGVSSLIQVGLKETAAVEIQLSCMTALLFLYQTSRIMDGSKETSTLITPTLLEYIKKASEHPDNPRIANVGKIVYEEFIKDA